MDVSSARGRPRLAGPPSPARNVPGWFGRAWPGAVAGLALGLLALGPGLRRGFLLTYDMLFVPREPFSSALPGLAPPRAVPSDLVMAVFTRALPADIVQKLVLLSIFVLACSGMAVLCEAQPALARLAAGVFYAWNPYVAERLIIGHWALLLGYAGLPWVLHAATRPDLASWRGAARLALVMVPAIVGGFAAMTVTALVVVPASLLSGSIKRAGTALGVLAAGSLPWLIPSLLHPVYADPAGVAAFAARADTPFGAFGSLLMLGGEWNAQTVPKGYGGGWSALWLAVVLAALAGFILLGRRRLGRSWAPLCVAAAAGLAVASVGVTAPGRDLLRATTGLWPGIAVFRDAQQFIAPLALAEAAGLGLVVAWAMNPGSFGTKNSVRNTGDGQRGRGRSRARRACPAGAGAAAAGPGLGRRGTPAAGLVPGQLARCGADDRRQRHAGRRPAAALGGRSHAGLEPRGADARSLVAAGVAPGDLERGDNGRERAAGARRPAGPPARPGGQRRRAADRGAARGRRQVRHI